MNTLKSHRKHKNVPLALLIGVFVSTNLFGTTYYVSTSGNDIANGTSPATAWSTLTKVNAQTFLPGDSILFRAGDTWRGELRIDETGTSSDWIYWGRYGEGKNPQMFGSEVANTWGNTGTSNIWKATNNRFTNYGAEYYAGNIFFYANDSVSWGEYQAYTAGFTNLTHQYDWTINNDTLFICSTSNPGTLYDKVEVTQRERVISMANLYPPANYIEVNGIDMHHGRRQGFFTGYPECRGATHLVFRNLDVSYIGERGSGSAYGLAIWHSNMLIENCTFSDCGRRAVSVNTYEDKNYPNNVVISNVIVRNNRFKRGWHTTSLDLSCQPTRADTLKKVYFYDNYIDDSDHPVVTLTSNQIFTQNGTDSAWVDSIYIVNNIFIHPTANAILTENGGKVFVWNNTITGINPNRTTNPWSSVCFNGTDSVDYRNNILYDNFPDNGLEYYGVLINAGNDAAFCKKDYNMYYTAFPGAEKCFSAHRVNSVRTNNMGYWNTAQWNTYKSVNTKFEQNSPAPGDPYFFSYANKDFKLTDSSAARNAGTILPDVFVKDPFGKIDNITKHDYLGNSRSLTTPCIGAYEYRDNYTSSKKLSDKGTGKLIVFPNPTGDFCKISVNNPASNTYAVLLYNLQGKKVYEKKYLKESEYWIPTGNLTPGMYIIKLVFDSSKTISKSFVIIK